MVEAEKTDKFNIKIEVKAVPCPKCERGYLLPFLDDRYRDENSIHPTEFSHYDLYYRCSNCCYKVDGITYPV